MNVAKLDSEQTILNMLDDVQKKMLEKNVENGIGAFIFLTIYSYTSIMDGKRYAAFLEIFKGILGMMGWYLLESSYEFGAVWVILMTGVVVYQSICIGLSVIYLLKAEIPQQVNV